jgi:hypothetical protein
MKITMNVDRKFIGIMAIAIAITLAPMFAQSANAENPGTKVRAFQNGVQLDSGNPGQVLTDTECIGGVDNDFDVTKMVCYLFLPSDTNNSDNLGYVAFLETTTNVACPSGAGFGADDECFSVLFDGSLLSENSANEGDDYHFHAFFYNSQDQVVTDGKKEFQNLSFFVLPESPIGVAALVASSLAALGGFMFLRSRNTSLPI